MYLTHDFTLWLVCQLLINKNKRAYNNFIDLINMIIFVFSYLQQSNVGLFPDSISMLDYLAGFEF
jgi:hypothetical protein